jgi:vacuolar protein sorting-associated protein 51
VADAADFPHSDVPTSEIDSDGFDPDAYVKSKLKDSSLEELLKTYTRVLGEIRALDAEKKALVYDNYSKLITATETIRKVPHSQSLGSKSGRLWFRVADHLSGRCAPTWIP